MTQQAISPDTDRRLVAALVARSLIDEGSLARVRAEHERAAAAGRHGQSLARLLCDRGLVDPRVAAAVLRSVRSERVVDSLVSSRASRPAAGATAEVGRFKQYVLLAELGRGGMGVVYRAHDTNLQRSVALKMIQDPAGVLTDDRERFAIEARAGAKVAHPGVVQVYEAGVHDGKPFIAMELVEGRSFEALLEGPEPVPPRRTAEIVRGVAEALQHAHEKGVVHRDVKPQNILLDREGRPHLADFGLARDAALDARITLTGEVVGTPAYLAPEQARGDVAASAQPAVDVYALGVVLYRALAGRPPFAAGQVNALLLAIVTEEPEPLRRLKPSVHLDLETIAHRCLAKDPARRYASAGAVAVDLRRFLDGEAILGRPVGRLERLAARARRQPALVGAVLVAALLAAALPVVLAVGRARTRAAEEEARREAAALAEREAMRATLARLAREARESDEDIRKVWDHVGDLDLHPAVRTIGAAREAARIVLPPGSPHADELASLRRAIAASLARTAVLARNVDDFESVIDLSERLIELGAAREVLPEFEAIAAIGSDAHRHNRARLGLAMAALGRGNIGLAERQIAAVRSSNPLAASPHSLQAELCINRRDRPGALSALARAIELAPLRIEYRLERARVRRGANDFAGALADLDVAIGLTPSNPVAHTFKASTLVRAGRAAEALRVVADARHAAPDDSPHMRDPVIRRENAVTAGIAHLMLKDFPASERELDEAIALGDQPRIAFCWRGALRQELGRRAEAIADFRHFLDDPGEEPPAVLNLARQALRELEGR